MFPFRTQGRTDGAPPERLESINREEGREGVRAFKPAAATIRKIKSTKRPSPGRIQAWIDHPDESVPLALAERHLDDRVWSGRWDGVFGPALLERAQRAAAVEGLLWTPLLDLASLIVDPEATGVGAPPLELLFFLEEPASRPREEVLEELSRFRVVPLVREVARMIQHPTDELFSRLLEREGGALGLAVNPTLSRDHRDRVGGWVLSQLTESDHRSGSRKRDVSWGHALRLATILKGLLAQGWEPPPELVASLRQGVGEVGGRGRGGGRIRLERMLAAGVALSALGLDEGIRVVESLAGARKVPLDLAGIRWLGTRGLLTRSLRYRVFLRGRSPEEIRAALDHADRLEEEDVEALINRTGLLDRPEGQDPPSIGDLIGEYLNSHPGLIGTFREASRKYLQHHRGEGMRDSSSARRTALLLLLNLATTEEHLLGLEPFPPPPEELSRGFLDHGVSGPRLWMEIVGWPENSRWLKELAKVPRARRHPEVRPALLTSADPEVWKDLLMDGVPAELRTLLPRLVDSDPKWVAEILRINPQALLEGMDPIVLKPMLESEHQELRQRAFEAIVLVGEGPAPDP